MNEKRKRFGCIMNYMRRWNISQNDRHMDAWLWTASHALQQQPIDIWTHNWLFRALFLHPFTPKWSRKRFVHVMSVSHNVLSWSIYESSIYANPFALWTSVVIESLFFFNNVKISLDFEGNFPVRCLLTLINLNIFSYYKLQKLLLLQEHYWQMKIYGLFESVA